MYDVGKRVWNMDRGWWWWGGVILERSYIEWDPREGFQDIAINSEFTRAQFMIILKKELRQIDKEEATRNVS